MKSIKKYLFVILLSWAHFYSVAQNHKADSLLSLVKTAKADTEKVNIYMNLYRQFVRKDIDKAENYLNEAMKLATSLNWIKGIAQSLANLGNMQQYHSRYKEALEYYKKAETPTLKAGNKKMQASLYNNMGAAQMQLSDYTQSLTYFLKSVKIKEQINDEKGAAETYINIGLIYKKQNQYDKAVEYYNKSLSIFERAGNTGGMADIYSHLGVIYKLRNDFAKALEYSRKALAIYTQEEDKAGMNEAYINLGLISMKLKKPNEAEKYYLLSLKLTRDMHNAKGEAVCMNNLGDILLGKKDFSKAGSYYEKALLISEKIKDRDGMKYAYEGLAICNYYLNRFKLAYDYHKLYSDLKDSIMNTESMESLNEMQTRYETDKKDKEILILNKDKVIGEAEIARQKADADKKNAQRNVFIVGFGLMVVLAGFIFRSYRQKQKANIIITQQKQEVEEAKKVTEHQKETIEEKQKEILDSIRYARRIQQSLLPTEKYITRQLSSSTKKTGDR